MPITILAIETSADETSAAVFSLSSPPAPRSGDRGRVRGGLLSNIIYSQIPRHKKTGGIVPEVAARAHIPKVIPAIKLALAKAKIQLSDLDYIAVTTGPGLITSLRIGVDTAKTLAYALGRPIIPVNHLEGHLLSAFGGNFQFSIFNFQKFCPALGLVVSGGHTMLVLVKDVGKYKTLGETLDDAAGEAFDKIAKILGLDYPGGPALAKLAEQGDPKAFDLPRPMISHKNYNFSFAGLKTAVLYLARDLKAISYKLKADVAASAEQAIVDVLVTKTLRAAKENKVKTILLGGGVAANKKLRQILNRKVGKTYNLLLTPYNLTGDNAGMIALAASFHANYNHMTAYGKVKTDPNLRLKSWR